MVRVFLSVFLLFTLNDAIKIAAEFLSEAIKTSCRIPFYDIGENSFHSENLTVVKILPLCNMNP